MPKRRETGPPESDDDPYQWFDAAVAGVAQTDRIRLSKKYDGVMGEPDDWIPKNFQREFRAAQDRL